MITISDVFEMSGGDPVKNIRLLAEMRERYGEPVNGTWHLDESPSAS